MDLITQTDMLLHCVMKLSEANDELESCDNELRLMEELVTENWQGRAAEALKEKLFETRKTIDNARNSLERAKQKIGGISAAM